MKILINDHRKIFTIQEEFNIVFPYLKLEFFSQPHLKGAEPIQKMIKPDDKTLAEYRIIHKQGEITISGSMTVADLEQNFFDIYGLEVQIFRKSGKAWLGTTITDSWTLEEQNKQGESLSKGLV